MRKISTAPLAILSLIMACSDSLTPETNSDPNPLYYHTGRLWGSRDILVCWSETGYSTEKRWVREALRGQGSWSQFGNINFVGWRTCPSGSVNGIRIVPGPDNFASYLGQIDGDAGIMLDFVNPIPQALYGRCYENNLNRENCIKATALHEFGHALGYAHEQNRGDTPSSCTIPDSGANGNSVYSEWDENSIMNYCSPQHRLSATDRSATGRIYGARTGDDPRLADYNGDSRADLLCFDVLAGSVGVDFGGSDYYSGNDWFHHSGWCDNSDTRRLLTGDFNGDGRDDLLCFDVETGSRYIDFAAADGSFASQDWAESDGWCNATDTRTLLVGDFNGDDHDDLLCFDTESGELFIDRASGSGTFGGTDWASTHNWCDATNYRRLYVGDFNGDGRDDLYCHDVWYGQQFIDYASSTGTFAGTEWSRSEGWCSTSNDHIRIDDFDGDGRDDLLCYNSRNGEYGIDFAAASSSARFAGNDFYTGNGFCNSNGARLYTGDVNGDGRSDLVCHHLNGGKWVDLINTLGQFGTVEWYLNIGYCEEDSEELH